MEVHSAAPTCVFTCNYTGLGMHRGGYNCWAAYDLHGTCAVTYCVVLDLAVMQVASLFLLQQVLQTLKLVYVE